VGVTYTTSGVGAGLWNFPDTSPPRLTPNDVIVTSLTSTSLIGNLDLGGGASIVVELTGQFSNIEGQVGKGLGDVTQTVTGFFSAESSTVTSDGAQYTDRFTYNPPETLAPITTLAETQAEIETMYAGDDLFIGDRVNAGGDGIYGYGGNDRFVMTYSDEYTEKFRGGEGVDTAVFESASEHWTINPTDSAWNTFTQQGDLIGYNVTDTRFLETDTYGQFGHTLQIVEVERLEFTDKKVALDFDRGDNSYKAASLITTMFGAELIPTYFAPAVSLVDKGSTDGQIAQLVIDLGLLDTSSNETFFSEIYQNVLGVEPDALTQALYVNQLDSGQLSHAGLVVIGSNASIIEAQMSELTTWREVGLEYLGF